ncbi:ATP-binding cassette, subfamily B, heavy metal transporter [Pancytospora philotis]|nr:ATP-binding cassette, subfamily B, heavy metal transporter [Pancytospora philotis]
MKYVQSGTTLSHYLKNCTLSSSTIVAMLLCIYVTMVTNVALNIRLKHLASSICSQIAGVHAPDDNAPSDLMAQMCALAALHYMLSSLQDFLRNRIGIRIFRRSLCDAVKDVTVTENSEFHNTGTGKVQDAITRSSSSVTDLTMLAFIEIPSAVLYIIGYAYTLAALFYPHVAACFFLGIFFAMVSAFFLTHFIRRSETRVYAAYRSTLLYLTDILLNFDVIQAFNREGREAASYDRSFDDYDTIARSYHRSKHTFSFLQKMLLLLPHFVVVYLLIRGYDLGMDRSKALYYNSLFISFKGTFITLRNCIFDVYQKSIEAQPRFDTRVKQERGCIPLLGFRSSIELKSADLYAGDALVNTDLSFCINKGDKVAITGFNGAGKSTFLKTLCRFHEGRHGIYIDGVDIRKYTDASVRNQIAYVPQDHHIFNNTVLYNLAYAQTKYDEQEIYRVCEQYGFHGFFRNLPNGYQTQAGEKGKYLSGGQKQRISFMRAIIKGAPIIVLDEPSSSLDKAAEVELVDTIFRCARNTTVLIIIHNHEILGRFEKILYFKENGVQVFDSYASFMECH